MVSKPRFSFDERCADLADHFLRDASHLNTFVNRDKLAQTIQDAVEAWFADAEDTDTFVPPTDLCLGG